MRQTGKATHSPVEKGKGRMMKKIFLIISLVSIFSWNSSAEEEARLASRAPKKRIAVIDFANKTSFAEYDIGKGVADMLTTSLWKTDKFVLVERSHLEKVIKEQNFSTTDLVASETAVKIGRILGLNAIVVGGITEYGLVKEMGKKISRIGVDMRLVDVGTARIILAENAVGMAAGKDVDQASRRAVDNLVSKIVSSLEAKPWEGRIMEVEASQVYINAGLNLGIRKGDVFAIISLSKELVDPVTGKVVGAIEKKIGKVRVIKVEEEYSQAETLEGSGFKRNDLVREIRD